MYPLTTTLTNYGLILQTNRAAEMKKQLLERDRDGWSVAMHAVRAGHIVVVETVLEEVRDAGVSQLDYLIKVVAVMFRLQQVVGVVVFGEDQSKNVHVIIRRWLCRRSWLRWRWCVFSWSCRRCFFFLLLLPQLITHT